MNTKTISQLSEADQDAGFLRRAGRTLLGSAAILIVGAAPAAHAATGVGARTATAQHSTHTAGANPSAPPNGARESAARFRVNDDGTLTRLD